MHVRFKKGAERRIMIQLNIAIWTIVIVAILKIIFG